MKIDYWIDQHDRLERVGGDWTSFALDNEGHELEPERVIGESIWRYIAGAEISNLYRQLFTRLRRTRGTARFPFRCDSPDARRQFDMRIRGHEHGSLSIESVAREIVQRPPIAVFDTGTPHSTEFVRMCAWCQRIHSAEHEWIEVEHAVQVLELFQQARPPRVTHGVCPPCLAALEAEADEHT